MKHLPFLATFALLTIQLLTAQEYIPSANLSFTGSATLVETDQRTVFNATPNGGTPATLGRPNLALASNGANAFESSNIDPTYGDDKLNNGVYGAGQTPNNNDSTRSWISLHTETNGWGGVKFVAPSTLGSIGFGSRFNSRADGDFTLQYTLSDFTGVDLETPAQVDALTWVNIGTLTSTTSGEFGRHLFALTTPVPNVTGVRIVVAQAGSSITEIEAYAPVVVTALTNNGAGSLRDRIAIASSGDTITFDPSLSGMTISLVGQGIFINKSLTIDASALPGGITITSNNTSRVIHIDSGNVVTLDSLTITGGNLSVVSGGGIRVNQSTLTLQNSTITGNTAFYGGGIYTRTDLAGVTTTLINCTITNNSATTRGGGASTTRLAKPS